MIIPTNRINVRLKIENIRSVKPMFWLMLTMKEVSYNNAYDV